MQLHGKALSKGIKIMALMLLKGASVTKPKQA